VEPYKSPFATIEPQNHQHHRHRNLPPLDLSQPLFDPILNTPSPQFQPFVDMAFDDLHDYIVEQQGGNHRDRSSIQWETTESKPQPASKKSRSPAKKALKNKDKDSPAWSELTLKYESSEEEYTYEFIFREGIKRAKQ
jgi:hypothetical protein